MPLTMSLTIDADNRLQTRQNSTTDFMLWKPADIIDTLSEHFQKGKRICMLDVSGNKRYLYTEKGIIPAGSLILTGTPGGTAIQKPDLFDKIELFLQGGLNIQGAGEVFIKQSKSDSKALGYLQEDDIMYTSIDQLGSQRHVIKKSEDRNYYGYLSNTADCSYQM